MALFLTAAALLRPGDAVAVEDPGYPRAAAAFRAAGARVLGVPVDDGGLCVEHLEALAAAEPALRAVFVTPHHQYPTTVTLAAARRLRLLELARRHGWTLVEDDYDHEYCFEGRPVLPLAARPGTVPVVYLGSLSKVLAPGLRLGYATAPAALLQRMAALRPVLDGQGDGPLEEAVATLMREGDLGRHLRRSRGLYRARRDRLVARLADRLPDALEVVVPTGGLALWARLRGGPDAVAWSRAARYLGLGVLPGAACALDPSTAPQAFRLGFAGLDEAEIDRAVDLLSRAREEFAPSP